MKLKNAAKFFDTCPVYDGYSGALLFRVQASTFLESSVEGSTASRRVVSLAPEHNPPTHSCVFLLNELWLLGAVNPDEWAGQAIRKAYWTKKITDSFAILTPAQAVRNEAGTAAFGQKKFLRETINTQTDAELDPHWDIFLSSSLAMPRGYFLRAASTLYRVRMSYVDVDGFRTCQSDELDLPPQDAVFTSSNDSYDPATDKYSATHVAAKVLLIDYSKAFTKSEITDNQMQPGDVCMLLPKGSFAAANGNVFQLAGSSRYAGQWRIMNVYDEHDVYNCHIRRT